MYGWARPPARGRVPRSDRALDALARGAGNPGGARHRRRFSSSIFSVTVDGRAVFTGAAVHATVTDAHPSALGGGLLDITLDAGVDHPLPAGARHIWEQWRSGRPTAPGEWAQFLPQLRPWWTAAAQAHHRTGTPDGPAGRTYHLDGRHVTTLESFYCALGEAINGPGGYFGGNAQALRDCLGGGFGAASPFRLVWHDSSVAAQAPCDHGGDGPVSVLALADQWPTMDGIVVDRR